MDRGFRLFPSTRPSSPVLAYLSESSFPTIPETPLLLPTLPGRSAQEISDRPNIYANTYAPARRTRPATSRRRPIRASIRSSPSRWHSRGISTQDPRTRRQDEEIVRSRPGSIGTGGHPIKNCDGRAVTQTSSLLDERLHYLNSAEGDAPLCCREVLRKGDRRETEIVAGQV